MKSEKQSNSSWIGFVIREKTFALSILIVLAVGLSMGAWLNIPIEVMPKENTPPFLYVHVDSSEMMSPERMELALTLPVEGVVRTLSGVIKYTTSTNSRGVSISLSYKPRTDLDLAELNIQEGLQGLESQGLLDMRGVSISRLNPDVPALIRLAVTYDNGVADPIRVIKDDFRLGLEAIPEVSKVEISGIEPLQYQYNIPRSRAQEFGLDGQGLREFLDFQPLRVSVGEATFGSTTTMTGINARLILNNLAQVQNQTMGRYANLTLREVASEQIIDQAKTVITRKNGKSSIFVEIFNKDGANLFDLNRHLQDYLSRIGKEKTPLAQLRFETVLNRTDDIKIAIDDVFQSLYEAMLITFLIVFLFLRRLKPTLLISLTIPMTLLMTIFTLFVRGTSLNILTLSGLILGIGMVVDAAVLVVGRISELQESGTSEREACARGATDAMNALFMSTLTNAAIFLPVAFIEGGDSFTDILKAFQVPIVASLAASLLVSLLFLPVAMMFWRDPAKFSGHDQEVSESSFAVRSFRWFQSHRKLTALCTIVFVGAVAQWVSDINETDLDAPREPYSTINMRFTAETKPEIRRENFETLEKELLSKQAELNYRFIVADFNPQYLNGTIMAFPQNGKDHDQELELLERRLKLFLNNRKLSPGCAASIGWTINTDSASVGPQIDTLRFTGPKMSQLNELLEKMKLQLTAIAGVEAVKLEKEESGERNVVFVPDEALLSAYGLSLEKISTEISTVMASTSVSNLNFNGKAVAANIAFVPDGKIWTLDLIKQMKIRVSDTRFINLMDLGTLVPKMFSRSVSRADGLASGKIFVHMRQGLTEEALANARTQIRSVTNSFPFPQGYGFPKNDSATRIEEMQNKSRFVIMLSLLLIYLLLASMFESVLLPFAVLFTVPLALVFGVAGLKLMGLDFDVMARLSMVILVGIGVNAAIILIDLIETLRSQGIRRSDAVVIGCARRLKAVLMTAAIQIISVLPVALGKAKIMGIPYSSLGVSIISGMLFSTLVTLIVLPMIYEILDNAEERLKSFLGIGRRDMQADVSESRSNQARAA